MPFLCLICSCCFCWVCPCFSWSLHSASLPVWGQSPCGILVHSSKVSCVVGKAIKHPIHLWPIAIPTFSKWFRTVYFMVLRWCRREVGVYWKHPRWKMCIISVFQVLSNSRQTVRKAALGCFILSLMTYCIPVCIFYSPPLLFHAVSRFFHSIAFERASCLQACRHFHQIPVLRYRIFIFELSLSFQSLKLLHNPFFLSYSFAFSRFPWCAGWINCF